MVDFKALVVIPFVRMPAIQNLNMIRTSAANSAAGDVKLCGVVCGQFWCQVGVN